MPDKWNLISWIVGQVGRQTSCRDLSFRHQKKDPSVALPITHTECNIEDFTKMVDDLFPYFMEWWMIYIPLFILQNYFHIMYIGFFFSIWVFFHNHSRITGLQEKGEGISLTPHYHFHRLHRYLDISRAITEESSPLHIGSSWTRTENFWFPNANR